MEILNEITKEVFETNVPAAKMPERNTSVHNRLREMFSVAYTAVIDNLLSPAHEGEVDTNLLLKTECVRLVCLEAFIRTCRSLDVVLTATGFGIVSTESTAPASRARVDALVEELSIERLLVIDRIIAILMFVNGWGETEQAKQRIATLFYSPRQLRRLTSLPFNTANWQFAKGRAVVASALLCEEISEEYMEELLLKQRTASLGNADIIVVEKCLRFMGDFISRPDPASPNKQMLRGVVEQLETNLLSYPTYKQSRLYAKRHAERYQNQKEDPTFFFM